MGNQWVKVVAIKSQVSSLSSIPGTHIIDSGKLFSLLFTCGVAHSWVHAQINVTYNF